MITNKTLKYSHAKTCGIVKPSPDIIAIKQVGGDVPNVIKQVSAIKQRNTINKEDFKQETTLEEMRRNYYINAKQQRTQRMQSLFANAI